MASISCVYAVDIAVAPSEKLFFHNHNCVELIFIIDGSGFVFTENGRTPYQPGYVIVCPRGNTHADSASCSGLQFCVGVDGIAPEDILPGVWRCSEQVSDAMQQLHEKVSGFPGRQQTWEMDILAGYLVMQIRKNLPEINSTTCQEPEEYDICETTRRELDAHIDAPYTLDQLASKVFVSKGYLRKLFKKKYGESPLSYLLRRKLDYAEELLRITDLSVQDISRKVGIENAFYFSAMFARKRGMSPTKYREKHKRNSR